MYLCGSFLYTNSFLGPWLDNHSPTQVFSVLAVINFIVTMTALPMLYWGKRLRIGTADSYVRFVKKMNHVDLA